MSRRWMVGVAALVVLVVAGGWAAWYYGLIFNRPSISGAPSVPVPTAAVTTIASGLDVPWGIAFVPDGSALVTERDSRRVLSVRADGTVTEVQRITDAQPAGEGGLLGVAVSPNYATDRWIYVYYTASEDNRIARFRAGETPQPIFTGIPKAGNHNGGRIAFGPDGFLYVGTGDAGDRDRSQDRGDVAGKILRLTPEGQPAPGNPFPGSPVYSYGHRNVQGLAWDAAGQLYASEFGQNQYDELNRISAGANYGWPIVEGMTNDSKYVNPIATWATSDASPSGIAIRDGEVFMACLRGTKLYRLQTNGDSPVALLDDEYGRLRAVAVAPDRTLWILTSNRDGRGDPIASDDRIVRVDASKL